MSIYNKLFKLQEEAQALAKSANNPFFKSQYLPLDAILEHFIPLFNKHKILCLNRTENDEVITELIDLEGAEEFKIGSNFKITNTDPQKRGWEITYGRRYNLWQLLNIMTETDDDWNKASDPKATTNDYNKLATDLEKPAWSLGNCAKCWAANVTYQKSGKVWCGKLCWKKW